MLFCKQNRRGLVEQQLTQKVIPLCVAFCVSFDGARFE